MSKGTAIHKQIKKLNEKAKTRKALDDVQRATKVVHHDLPKPKLKKIVGDTTSYPWNNIASWPGFKHFDRRRKKGLGKNIKHL